MWPNGYCFLQTTLKCFRLGPNSNHAQDSKTFKLTFCIPQNNKNKENASNHLSACSFQNVKITWRGEKVWRLEEGGSFFQCMHTFIMSLCCVSMYECMYVHMCIFVCEWRKMIRKFLFKIHIVTFRAVFEATTVKSRFNEWPPSAHFYFLNRDFTLNRDFLMWNLILVTRFCSLNRDFTLNWDSLNRDFTVHNCPIIDNNDNWLRL